MNSSYRVMFVCTGNTCRSPMAEGGLRKLLENRGIDNIEVFSSGTAAASGFPATAYAIEASRIWEADITGHHSRPLTAELIERADLILAMTPQHCYDIIRMLPEARGKIFLLKNFPAPGCEGEGIADPIGGSLDMYNQTFIEIGEELGRILPDIIARAGQKDAE
ncbi:Low molecular weight protein-tyrosine-phosphatase YwlE [Candidatus Zixiibacteriota bacterium]|nr:Low molecular weight protein-tyrosine-phosphatase YwlE [candidate division Zixibacteria bacterium]